MIPLRENSEVVIKFTQINPENTDGPLGKKEGPIWYVMIIYPAAVQWEEPSIHQAISGERSTISMR